MSIINTIVCSAAGGNTGIPDCAFTFKTLVGGFLVPSGFELTEAQLASPQAAMAALLAAVNNDDPTKRIFPLPPTVTFTDNTEDPVFQTFGLGGQGFVRDGKYNFLIQYTKGGNCISNALTKFNNGNYSWLGFDAAGVLIGTKVGTSLKGVPLEVFYNRPFRMADGTNVALFAYMLSFDPNYINQNVGFIQFDFAELTNSLKGLENVNISGTRAAAVITAKLTKGCAGTDLYNTYSVEFAAAGNWVALMNGKVVPITGVVAVPASFAWTVTLDTASPNYVAGAPIILNLAKVSVLTAAGITGLEGIAHTFLIP